MTIFKSHFNHEHLRKYETAFGTLFTGYEIVRYDSSRNERGRIPVPLDNAPKEKWVRRLMEDKDLDRQPAITLPRMAFEMTSLQYDPSRMRQKNLKIWLADKDANTKFRAYTPVPWDLQFNLYIASKTKTDVLQLVEQILPAFRPDYVITVRGMNKPEQVSWDIPISLLDVMINDSFSGSFEDNRVIIWSLSFNMKAYLFSPVTDDGVIKIVDIDWFDTDEGRGQYMAVELTPYLDGVPLEDIKESDPWVVREVIDEDPNG